MNDPTGQTPHYDGFETEEDIEDARQRALNAVLASQGSANYSDLVNSEEDYPIYDTITNLLHLGDCYGFDADELIESARYHYICGKQPEGEDA